MKTSWTPKDDGGGEGVKDGRERGCERLLERDNRYREGGERIRDISKDSERRIMRGMEREKAVLNFNPFYIR